MTQIVCADYTRSDGSVFKGCGQSLRWPTDAEKPTLGKRPLNLDGTKHMHPKGERPATAKPVNEVAVEAAKKVLVANEEWVRQIAQDEAAKLLKKHGIGIDAQQ